MAAIDEYLQQILDAVYGEEVRGAIHDAIKQVYDDGQTGVPTSRTINGKSLDADITLSASDVGAVPTTRTVNSKALSSNITLSASDVGAVPTTRTVNSKALSADVSLDASDVNAVAKSGDTMTGGLSFISNGSFGVDIKTSASGHRGLSMRFVEDSNSSTERTYFYQFKTDNSHYDLYKLPATTLSETANGSYDILTTKSPVGIEHGGTGSGTASGALANLGAVSKTGDTMTGRLNTKNLNVYSGSWPGIGFALSSDPDTSLVSINYDDSGKKFTFICGTRDGTNTTEAFTLPGPTYSDGNYHGFDIVTAKQIISGRGSGSIAANSYQEITQNFSRPLTSTPRISLTMDASDITDPKVASACTAYVVSRSATGFKYRIYNGTSAARTLAVNWIALAIT